MVASMGILLSKPDASSPLRVASLLGCFSCESEARYQKVCCPMRHINLGFAVKLTGRLLSRHDWRSRWGHDSGCTHLTTNPATSGKVQATDDIEAVPYLCPLLLSSSFSVYVCTKSEQPDRHTPQFLSNVFPLREIHIVQTKYAFRCRRSGMTSFFSNRYTDTLPGDDNNIRHLCPLAKQNPAGVCECIYMYRH